MKANKTVMSALLGIALLSMPITAAAAHDHDRDRTTHAGTPAFRPASAPHFVPRSAVALRADQNAPRHWTSPEPIVPVRERDDYYGHDRDDLQRYRGVDGYRYLPPPYAEYRPGYYQPSDAPPAYTAPAANCLPAPLYYGGPVAKGGVAALRSQRDSAQYLYDIAVRNGNRLRAKHLHNDIVELNKRIAGAGGGRPYACGPYGYSTSLGALAGPYANSYSYNSVPHGYGNLGGLGALVSPLLGNYVH